jgi:hypothetical protein
MIIITEAKKIQPTQPVVVSWGSSTVMGSCPGDICLVMVSVLSRHDAVCVARVVAGGGRRLHACEPDVGGSPDHHQRTPDVMRRVMRHRTQQQALEPAQAP